MSLRTLAGVVASIVLAAACSSAATPAPQPEDGPSSLTTPDAAPSAPAATCGAIEHPTLQGGTHLIGDAEPPVPYSSVPPTSGWHASGAPVLGLADEPLTDPQIVLVLETGGVVLALAPGLAVDQADLDGLLASFPEQLAITRYEQPMPTPAALVAWGVLQRCDDLDPAAVAEFVMSFADESAGHA